MYANTTTKIKISNGLSTVFTSDRGVKQGDALSSTLFNILIDDIVKDLFTGNCCLLYAES